MNRRDFINAIGLAVACYPISGHASVTTKGPDKWPNIIYILADDLGYLALSAVYNPVAPAGFCEGQSGIGEYGDFVCEVDWTVREVLKALVRNKMADNTLVIFTSDNGADKGGVKANLEKFGHHVSYIYRGCKADI
jgi:arylsulfatase A-like enzyme